MEIVKSIDRAFELVVTSLQFNMRERERERERSCGEPSNNLPRYSEPPRRVILEKGHCLVRPSRYHGVLQVPGY